MEIAQPVNPGSIFYASKVDKFYEAYKNKLIETHGEKIISNMKEVIYKLTELEILIARLEKYDPNNLDMKNNYQLYIATAKKLLEENELKLNEDSTRNMTFVKFFLSLKMSFFCRKIKMSADEEYFNNYNSKINLSSILEAKKGEKRSYLFQDELLEGIFEEEIKKKASLFRVREYI